MELLTAIIMMIMSFIVFSGLESMGAYSSLLRVVDLCVERGREVLDLEPMDIAGDNVVPQTNNINVSNIDFAYDKKKIIDDVSLCISEKTISAFVGPSGGGKTTLCHLIARFWDVNNGISRRSWARNPSARFAIEREMGRSPELKVTLPNFVEDSVLDKLNF